MSFYNFVARAELWCDIAELLVRISKTRILAPYLESFLLFTPKSEMFYNLMKISFNRWSPMMEEEFFRVMEDVPDGHRLIETFDTESQYDGETSDHMFS